MSELVLSRRRILTGLIAAPAVLRLGLHMPVRSFIKTHVYGESWAGKNADDILKAIAYTIEATYDTVKVNMDGSLVFVSSRRPRRISLGVIPPRPFLRS